LIVIAINFITICYTF